MQWDIQLFCTDHWKAYAKVLPSEKHIQSKAQTYTVESVWSDLRHWLARFKRRSKVVSKKREMIELSLGLFFNLKLATKLSS